MKKTFTNLLLSLLIVWSTSSAWAQWQKSGPDGGIVYNVAINGSEWLCLTNAGVFKSTDGGNTWVDASAGLPTATLLSIIRQGSLYMVSTSLGVYTSTNGNSWTRQSTNSFRLTYADATQVYGVTWPTTYNNIFNSTDGGVTFGVKTITSPSGAVTSNGTRLFAASGTSISYLNGATWSGFPGSGLGTIVDVKYFTGQGLVIASSTGIYRHSDNPSDFNPWTIVSTGLTASYGFSNLAFANNKYYVVGRNYVGGNANGAFTIYTSTDLNTWTVASTAFSKSKIYTLQGSGNDLIACTSHGLFVSSDNGQTWTLKMTGVKAHYVTGITGNTTTLFAATSNTDFMSSNSARYHYGGALFKSSDDGQSWTKTGLPDSIGVKNILVVNNTVFAVGLGYNSYSRSLYRSSDAGTTWQVLINDTEDPVSLLYHNNNLYVATSFGMKKSIDLGDNWTDLTVSDFRPGSTYSVASTTNNIFISNDYYFSVVGGGIYKSSDNGANWSIINNNYQMGLQSNGPISKMASDGSVLFATTFFSHWTGNSAGLYRSIDNGLNWLQIMSPVLQQKINAFHSWSGNTYMGTGLDGAYYGDVGSLSDSASVYVTSDLGVSWQDVTGNLPEITVNALYVHNGKLFAGTFGGVYVSDAISGSISQPAPLSTLGSSANVTFTWSVENVDNVLLEYSTNGGFTWNTIVTNLPSNSTRVAAINGQYTWTVPNITASQIVVRLKDFDSGLELNRATYNISGSTATMNGVNGKIGFIIYPNPSSGVFTTESDEEYILSVTDIYGSEVYKGRISGITTLNLNFLSKGVYSCNVQKDNEVSVTKLVIE